LRKPALPALAGWTADNEFHVNRLSKLMNEGSLSTNGSVRPSVGLMSLMRLNRVFKLNKLVAWKVVVFF